MKDLLKFEFLKAENFSDKAVEISLLLITVLFLAFSMTSLHSDFLRSLRFEQGDVANHTVRAPRAMEYTNTAGEKIDIARGEVLIRAGDKVNAEQAEQFAQIVEQHGSGNSFWMWFGYIILTGIIFLSVYQFSVRFWPGFRPQARDLALVAIVLVGSFLFVKGVAYIANFLSFSDASSILLATPVAAGGLLLQVTLGPSSVFIFVICFGLLTGVFVENSGMLLLLVVVGNLVGAVCIQHCSRRSAFLFAGVRVALVNAFLVLAFAFLVPDYGAGASLLRVFFAFCSGILSGVFGTGLAPVAEFIGGYVTDIKLLELASLHRPLLRELSVRAPGTWNHSIIMGQMGQVAADSIGANSLLTRVGAYYHDVGKIKKPDYFVENQSGKENKHDKLTPSMSALIIKAHVKDGIEMARKDRLPKAIIDFIPQHHGTSLIEFFYDKAKAEAEEEDEVAETHYRYGGPKPQSKEAGILMLADQVEASSRTLSDPTPAKIQGMVQKIINRVFSSGELEESNLTLKDLHLIARSFTRVLTGIFHRRVDYSEPVEKGKEAKAETKNGEKKESAEAAKVKSSETKSSSPKKEKKPKKTKKAKKEKNGERGSSAKADGEKSSKDSSSDKSADEDSEETLKRLGM